MNSGKTVRRLTQVLPSMHLALATAHSSCAQLRRYCDGLKASPFHCKNRNAPAPKSKLFTRRRRAKARCSRHTIYSHRPELRPSTTSRRAAYNRNSRALSSPSRTISGLNGVEATGSPSFALRGFHLRRACGGQDGGQAERRGLRPIVATRCRPINGAVGT